MQFQFSYSMFNIMIEQFSYSMLNILIEIIVWFCEGKSCEDHQKSLQCHCPLKITPSMCFVLYLFTYLVLDSHFNETT
jgi:hypothetical protein